MVQISKFILGFFLVIILSLMMFNTAIAQENEATSGAMSTFETFWPLTAGKTMDEQFYFLKTLKEDIRGLLIFGNAQRADYAVFLGTKRVLEAEKLLKEGKKDIANRTFDKALEHFEVAIKNTEEASNKKVLLSNSVATMKPRLSNLEKFLPTLNSCEANEVLQKVRDLNSKI